ncbi:hypothetical protein ABVT39_013425 [Epinephelus coioides]
MTPAELLVSDAVAVTFANRALQGLASVIPFLVALSCVGALNGGFFGAPRMLFVGAREGHWPPVFSMIHICRHTPMPAVLLLVPLAIAVIFTVVSFFIVGLSLYSYPWNTGQSFALTLTGVPVYYVTVYRFRLPNRCRRIFNELLKELDV